MFINLKSKNLKKDLLTWSIRRSSNGIYYPQNDEEVSFDPNPAVKSGLREKIAKIEALNLNKKRGPILGFDLKGY